MHRLHPFDPAKAVIGQVTLFTVSTAILLPTIAHHHMISDRNRNGVGPLPRDLTSQKRRARFLHPQRVTRFYGSEY